MIVAPEVQEGTRSLHGKTGTDREGGGGGGGGEGGEELAKKRQTDEERPIRGRGGGWEGGRAAKGREGQRGATRAGNYMAFVSDGAFNDLSIPSRGDCSGSLSRPRPRASARAAHRCKKPDAGRRIRPIESSRSNRIRGTNSSGRWRRSEAGGAEFAPSRAEFERKSRSKDEAGIDETRSGRRRDRPRV